MTHRLILLIDESWPAQASADWVLLDARDRVIEQGRSEARHWPAAGECEVVLAGPQCTWIDARLPRCARRDEARVLRYALEDRLVRDVEEQHLTVTDREPLDSGASVAVLAVSRSRLRLVLAQLEAIGRRPTRVVAELQVAAPPAHAWSVHVRSGPTWIVRPSVRTALAVDAAVAAEVVEHLLARANDGAPERLELRLAADVERQAAERFAAVPALPVVAGPPYQWWAGLHACRNLLHDEFATAHARAGLLRRLHAPAAIATAAGALLLAANAGEVAWQRHQLDAYEARMARLFESTVPDAPAIVPALQLRRTLDAARARHGRLRTDDFLALLDDYTAEAATATRGAVLAFEYDGGVLSVRVDAAGAAALPPLATRLQALGHDASAAGERLTLAPGAVQ
ncbi:MAG TPA: type II secretion system protein GspL [Rhodocyclaceae bacterium]|nr:type II secretion system protein GspL [Rhodocyclaceae bacterium]